MTGAFPLESFNNLSRLEALGLENLSGDQPNLLSSLTSLTNLKRLDLQLTKLTDTVPESMGRLTLLGKPNDECQHSRQLDFRHQLILCSRIS